MQRALPPSESAYFPRAPTAHALRRAPPLGAGKGMLPAAALRDVGFPATESRENPMDRRFFLQSTTSAAFALLARRTWAQAENRPKKILVLGGTWFLGPAVVDA